MIRWERTRRRAAVVIGGLVLAFAVSDGVLVSVGHAQQQDSLSANYGIYNGQVAAAADREQVFTSTNPGFTQGAVNNFYPLARVAVAGAGTRATASPADTGPFAQAVFAGEVPCPQPTVCVPGLTPQQPQYVYAQSPGTENPPPYNQGSASAAASVTPAAAKATATYGSTANSVGALPIGTDGSDGGTASDSTYFDSALGFVTVGDSRVQHSSYGGGVLVIDNVRVSVQVSTNGSGSFAQVISITVGGASVNGVPVTIDQNGVTVQQQTVPLGQLQTTTAQANAALAAAGLSVHTVAPDVTRDGTDLHVEASGVVVEQQQPVAPNGVPTQFVRHTLGVVILDNEATPALPALSLSTASDSSGGSASTIPSTSTITTVSGSSGGSSAGPATPSSQSPRSLLSSPVVALLDQPRPRWLLLGYLAWQTLVLALVGALYLRRSAQRRLA